jgi:hypothetical protein
MEADTPWPRDGPLPAQKGLGDAEHRRKRGFTEKNKREGVRKGQQYVENPEAAEEAR